MTTMLKRNSGPIILILTLAVNVLFGFGFGWYRQFWFFDIILHFLGGLGVALTVQRWLVDKYLPAISGWLMAVLLVSAAGLVGLGWEFAEYLASVFLPSRFFGYKVGWIGDLPDTLSDLLMDLVGGAAAGLHLFRNRKT